MFNRVDSILEFWFGQVEDTVVPSENRARIWFGEAPEVDAEIQTLFSADLKKAVEGNYAEWETSARGQLALILTLDQFSRHIERGSPRAFAQDDYALSICIRGMEHEKDHELSLIERVFFYFPLLHSEHLRYQEASVAAYEMLIELAFPETRVIYESFFKFANHHYNIVRRFGRFPQRNLILSRESTAEEKSYLEETEQQ